MRQVTLTKIFRSDKDKAGNPLKTSDGRPYERVAIKTEEYGERWLSGFGNKANSYWKERDEVEINIKEADKTDKDGRPYLNFEMPNVWDEVKDIKSRLAALEELMLSPKETKKKAEEVEAPEDLDF